MLPRSEFAKRLALQGFSSTYNAIALLWYYSETQQFDERTPAELATDLSEEGFPKPNVTRLAQKLVASKFTVRGKRHGSFRINIRHLVELENRCRPLIGKKAEPTTVSDEEILPVEWAIESKRIYLEKLTRQVNEAYGRELYDCCLVMCRRVMEGLLIETYVHQKRESEIKDGNGHFFALETLITKARSDPTLNLNRNAGKVMEQVKLAGDTSAHDRFYIARTDDVDDIKAGLRRLINELMIAAGLKT